MQCSCKIDNFKSFFRVISAFATKIFNRYEINQLGFCYRKCLRMSSKTSGFGKLLQFAEVAQCFLSTFQWYMQFKFKPCLQVP